MSFVNERLSEVDSRLAAALRRARGRTKHHGIRGNALADALGDEIQRHLIGCASVHKGCEARDTENRISREIDLVFLSRFHPAFLHDERPGLVYIEGVLAAAEVKTSLNRAEVADCVEKARHFKRLTAKIDSRDLQSHSLEAEDWDYFLWRRPFLAFAYEDRRDLSSIRDNIAAWSDENRIPDTERIDAVFVLNQGGIVNLRSGAGAPASPSHAGDGRWGILGKEIMPVFTQLILWLSRAAPDFSALSPILLRYAPFDLAAYCR